ncbi:hypothetical protein QBC34DRAFT_433751 [Podospora aff. communis PSN243]|uniref:Transmembrane protein n=1 Tax=Podospora aff. communis PSN243 TaxID=3040156 RepID=A0AAV9H2I7_9PEZI|nr:hypothetical protein QBC34DRAFT_433751 [Podospora aff. communis PSN243]
MFSATFPAYAERRGVIAAHLDERRRFGHIKRALWSEALPDGVNVIPHQGCGSASRNLPRSSNTTSPVIEIVPSITSPLMLSIFSPTRISSMENIIIPGTFPDKDTTNQDFEFDTEDATPGFLERQILAITAGAVWLIAQWELALTKVRRKMTTTARNIRDYLAKNYNIYAEKALIVLVVVSLAVWLVFPLYVVYHSAVWTWRAGRYCYGAVQRYMLTGSFTVSGGSNTGTKKSLNAIDLSRLTARGSACSTRFKRLLEEHCDAPIETTEISGPADGPSNATVKNGDAPQNASSSSTPADSSQAQSSPLSSPPTTSHSPSRTHSAKASALPGTWPQSAANLNADRDDESDHAEFRRIHYLFAIFGILGFYIYGSIMAIIGLAIWGADNMERLVQAASDREETMKKIRNILDYVRENWTDYAWGMWGGLGLLLGVMSLALPALVVWLAIGWWKSCLVCHGVAKKVVLGSDRGADWKQPGSVG